MEKELGVKQLNMMGWVPNKPWGESEFRGDPEPTPLFLSPLQDEVSSMDIEPPAACACCLWWKNLMWMWGRRKDLAPAATAVTPQLICKTAGWHFPFYSRQKSLLTQQGLIWGLLEHHPVLGECQTRPRQVKDFFTVENVMNFEKVATWCWRDIPGNFWQFSLEPAFITARGRWQTSFSLIPE